MIYLLQEQDEYDDCYYLTAYETKEEALKNTKFGYRYRFIEGEELKLTLTRKNDNE